MNRFSLLLAVGLAVPASCHACATVTSSPKDRVRLATDSALLVWNAKTHMEHLVCSANFYSQTENFGFLVPTPSRPQLSTANENIFNDIEREMSPKTKAITQRGINWTPFAITLFVGLSSPVDDSDETTVLGANRAVGATSTNAVQVVERKRIGNYNASVLRASDTEALAKWLRSHHYAVSSDTREWLFPYAKAGFYLTAFQLVSDLKNKSAHMAAVGLTFKSETPFYPYRETRDSQASVESRNLRLFYVGDKRVEGRIENQGRNQVWPARIAYSGNVDAAILRSYGLDVPLGLLRLTVLGDAFPPPPGWGDLRFYPALDQSEFVAPPHIAYNDKRWWVPVDLLALGAVLLLGYVGRLHKRNSI